MSPRSKLVRWLTFFLQEPRGISKVALLRTKTRRMLRYIELLETASILTHEYDRIIEKADYKVPKKQARRKTKEVETVISQRINTLWE